MGIPMELQKLPLQLKNDKKPDELKASHKCCSGQIEERRQKIVTSHLEDFLSSTGRSGLSLE